MKLIKVVLSFLMCLSMVACTNNESKNPSSSSLYPMTITDQLGREVTIEKEPERIVSGYYISTSTLLALDETSHLVGIENSADKRPVYAKVDENLLTLPAMGTVKTFDIEKCMTLSADLVVLPFKLSNIAKTLEDLNIPVIYVMPESQQLLEEMILLLGKVTNNEKQAKNLVTFMQDTLEDISETIKNEEKPRVYLSGNSSLLQTSGEKMFQHTLIENAGGINVAENLEDTYWAEVSYEQILTWDPEYIILASDATYSVEDVLNNEYLKTCTAIKNKNVFKLPNDIECFDSPLPSSVLGVSYLTSILHEDVYNHASYTNTREAFYEKFYKLK